MSTPSNFNRLFEECEQLRAEVERLRGENRALRLLNDELERRPTHGDAHDLRALVAELVDEIESTLVGHWTETSVQQLIARARKAVGKP